MGKCTDTLRRTFWLGKRGWEEDVMRGSFLGGISMWEENFYEGGAGYFSIFLKTMINKYEKVFFSTESKEQH